MRFGVCLPNYGLAASRESIVTVAKEAEGLGYESAWTTDHILVPESQRRTYGNLYESLITLAYVGAVTERIRIGTSILVLPIRNPILVAKQTAALDALSGGRLILGLGAGWLEEEFGFLTADFKRRGRIMDEGIRVLRTLWAEGEANFKGRYVGFSETVFLPKPAQREGPPIWVGGDSEAAIRRAAMLGDAWHPVGLSPEGLAEGIRRLRSLTGRKVAITARVSAEVGGRGARVYRSATGELRHRVTGMVEEISETLEEFARLGLEHLVLYFGDKRLEHLLIQMRAFARELMPSFKA